MRPDWMDDEEFSDPPYAGIGWCVLAVAFIVVGLIAWSLIA